MALKLTKEEKKERDEHRDKLGEALTAVKTAITAYNEAREPLWAAISTALQAYDEAREAAQEWAQGVASRFEDEMADKSERWLNSDRGSNAQSFQQEYESFEVPTLDMEDPGDIEEPDAAEDPFEGLPESVEG